MRSEKLFASEISAANYCSLAQLINVVGQVRSGHYISTAPWPPPPYRPTVVFARMFVFSAMGLPHKIDPEAAIQGLFVWQTLSGEDKYLRKNLYTHILPAYTYGAIPITCELSYRASDLCGVVSRSNYSALSTLDVFRKLSEVEEEVASKLMLKMSLARP